VPTYFKLMLAVNLGGGDSLKLRGHVNFKMLWVILIYTNYHTFRITISENPRCQ
jgi:hypothetical protein